MLGFSNSNFVAASAAAERGRKDNAGGLGHTQGDRSSTCRDPEDGVETGGIAGKDVAADDASVLAKALACWALPFEAEYGQSKCVVCSTGGWRRSMKSPFTGHQGQHKGQPITAGREQNWEGRQKRHKRHTYRQVLAAAIKRSRSGSEKGSDRS